MFTWDRLEGLGLGGAPSLSLSRSLAAPASIYFFHCWLLELLFVAELLFKPGCCWCLNAELSVCWELSDFFTCGWCPLPGCLELTTRYTRLLPCCAPWGVAELPPPPTITPPPPGTLCFEKQNFFFLFSHLFSNIWIFLIIVFRLLNAFTRDFPKFFFRPRLFHRYF